MQMHVTKGVNSCRCWPSFAFQECLHNVGDIINSVQNIHWPMVTEYLHCCRVSNIL